jgi:hypothetical protein
VIRRADTLEQGGEEPRSDGQERAVNQSPNTDAARATHEVRSRLRRVRRAARSLLTIRVVCLASVWGMLLAVALVLGDLLLRFPAAMRWIFLLGLAGTGAVWLRRTLMPLASFKPALSDVALRVESWLGARAGTPPGPIASAVELPIDDPDPQARLLSRLAARRARASLPRTPWGMLRWKAPAWALVGAVATALAVSAGFRVEPTLAVTGLSRLFMPWIDTPWPKRVQLADATPSTAHASDLGLALRATVLRTNRGPGETAITVSYRVLDRDGREQARGQAMLVPQPATDGRLAGELYERLIEPSAWQGTTGERWLEYRFSADDDETTTKRVRIVDPPVLVRRVTTIEPPAYAAGLPTVLSSERESAPPPHAGEAIEIAPVLEGSRVLIELEYNKEVSPRWDGEQDRDAGLSISAGGGTIRLETTASSPVRASLHAVDAFALSTREAARILLEVIGDAPPEATVPTPSADEVVLAGAVIEAVGEGRDDLSLTGVSLRTRVARRVAGSLGGEAAPGDDAAVIAESGPITGARAEVRASISLPAMGVEAGDEVWIETVAADNFALDGRTHAPVVSAPRRLRVISPSEFIEMIRAELEGLRRTAIRLDKQQGDLMERVASPPADEAEARRMEEAAARQSALSQRLRAQASVVDRLAARAERNALEDETLRRLLDSIEGGTELAARASERAGEALARSARDRQDRGESIEQDQRRVREELARLIDELDRGQDGWVVRRTLEQLLGDQRALRDRTDEAGGRTVGRTIDELTPDERTELERIAQRQRDLAERSRDAVDALSDRAESIRSEDPTQASAMDEAAREATREALTERLREAARQIDENQTASAGRLQDQSIRALEEMLDRLENAQRNRDSALRRQLASLIQSIESLIRQQSGVARTLGEDPARALQPAERAHGNTLAALSEARGSFGELRAVADLLARAGVSQADAIGALRATPRADDRALAHSNEALARLREALEEARKQDENAAQRERDQRRRELREAYRAALAEQVRLRSESEPFAGVEPDRRQRAELRALGQRQEGLRTTVRGLPDQLGPDGAGVLRLMHDRIDRVLTEAVRSLGRGVSDAGVLSNQDAAIGMLASIAETLTPRPREPSDEFESPQGGGGGGGQGGGEQPLIGNVEQLRLLRALQSAILDQTRAGGAPGDLSTLQREIAEQGRLLIESMRPPRPASPPGVSPLEEPTTPEGDEPGDPP